MLKYFFTTAFRFLWRNKSFTLLNYLCLTFGLTCSIVATLNIKRAFSYDKFHENYGRLYEVEANVTYFNGDRFPKQLLSASMSDLLIANVPEIESLARIVDCGKTFIAGEKSYTENGIYADPDFLSIFTFPLKTGSVQSALAENNSIAITDRMARKLFGSADCVGKTLVARKDSEQETFTVSAVLNDIPSLSYLQFDFIIPFQRFITENKQALEPGSSASMIWTLLHKDASLKSINERVKKLISEQETTKNQELFFFPLSEKILYSYSGGKRVWKELQYIVILGCIGFAILLIACFNYINLSIALNIRRYREAGIRKVAGARKFSIVSQHLGETTLLTLLCLATSIDLVRLAIGALNKAFNSDISFSAGDFEVIGIFAGITIFTALASGILPSLYLASSKPVDVLKGKIVRSHSFSFFRQSLIVFQFTIPVVLIICMMIVKTQDTYFRNYDLGFEKDRMLVIPNSEGLEAHAEYVRNDLLSIPGIESVSFSSCIPARGTRVTNDVGWEGKDPAQELHFWRVDADQEYFRTVNINVSYGRYFDKAFPSDSSSFVINDVAARIMDYKDPVGRTITIDGKKGTIIGVFRDFHTLDLAGPYTPTVIILSKEGKTNLLIKTGNADMPGISGRVQEVVAKYEPDKIWQINLYSDLPERSELTTVSEIIGLAFIISVILACMGLSGLAAFTAAGRTKEIGIRKINGATIASILRLLGMSYSRWILIASVISIPIAYILGTIFLARFNFRTPMPYWAFVAGPALAYMIALLAVGFQSWKAAARNPVEALRYE
ncbi:MAG: ABC transporter permease [Bacteroidales bacterium]|jgi:ABC-type antimicrobial peptide transport system permease subunit|nr:ABC transporter permease [Bacteroidales bacterium]